MLKCEKCLIFAIIFALFLQTVGFGAIGDQEIGGDFFLKGDEKSIFWYNGAYTWGEKASGSMAGSYIIIKPPNIGSTGQQLTTTVSGSTATLSWEAAGGIGGIGDIDAVGDAISGSVFTADGSGNSLWFEGSTADGYETILTAADTTSSDKTVTLRDASGTVILSGDTFTGDVTATLDTDGSTALTIAANAVALTTDTTGNYAAGDGEAGSALTGDTATAFFSAGTIEHEYGGLEADVSGYTDGLYGMASGVTADIDTIAEIETAIGGSTNILTETEIDASSELLALMDDETGTGALVFATSPTLVTPALGTIASGVGTALTALDGENIQNDTIDDDSIDFGDITGADLDLTDCTTITTTGAGTIGDGLTVNADNNDATHLTLEGRTHDGPLDKGGSIEWYEDASSIVGYTFANTFGRFVWSASAQDATGDSGVAWVDFTTGAATFNEDGSAVGDFRIESDNNTHQFFLDASTDRIGINKAAPAEAVDVTGNIKCDGTLKMWGLSTAEAGTARANWTVLTVAPTGASTANFYGAIQNVTLTTDQDIGSLVGAYYAINTTSSYSNTIDKVALLEAEYLADTDFNGTVTDIFGLHIMGLDLSAEFVDAGGNADNVYGLKIDDVEDANTLNYAIHTGTGDVYFGDDVEIVGELKGGRCVLNYGTNSTDLAASLYIKMINGMLCSATVGYPMPRAGSIVGIAAACQIDSATDDDFLDAEVYVIDTGVGTSEVFQARIALDSGSSGEESWEATQARGTSTFNAGDQIAVYFRETGEVVWDYPRATVEVQYDS